MAENGRCQHYDDRKMGKAPGMSVDLGRRLARKSRRPTTLGCLKSIYTDLDSKRGQRRERGCWRTEEREKRATDVELEERERRREMGQRVERGRGRLGLTQICEERGRRTSVVQVYWDLLSRMLLEFTYYIKSILWWYEFF